MNPIKSPHELLMEHAGFAPASPGMVNTGQQMLINQSGIVPHFADGGSIDEPEMSPQDMLAMLVAHNQTPQHFATGGSASPTMDQFERVMELAKRDPSFLKKMAHHTRGLAGAAGKAFDKLNPAFQAMSAIDTGERAMDTLERAHQGDYRGAAISGLGAIGSGIGMMPGAAPQLLSIPATMGADYLQEHYDETDPHESRFSLKNTTLNR
jgi:hypothetical protein